jgi:hypothetical protein
MGDWVAAGGGRGGLLVGLDLLIFIRMLTFLTADFGCDTKQFGGYNQNAKMDTVHIKGRTPWKRFIRGQQQRPW